MIKDFKVRVEMPKDVTITEMQDYIREAVQTWKGQMHPDEPLFDLNYKSVTVTPIFKDWRW